MKKIFLFFLLVGVVNIGFAERIILVNDTKYPHALQKSKIAIQWATLAKEVEESNNKLKQGVKLDQKAFQILKKTRTIHLNIPEKAEYFRVVVWSKGVHEPDFLTNWVDIVPNKTYTLNEQYLIPVALMAGMGC